MARVLLIDADVVAYQAAASVEQAIDWGDGFWTWHCDEQQVKDTFDAKIAEYMDVLKGASCKLCLTDSTGNFRRKILPTYKGNRASTKKPMILQHIKQWLIDERDAYFRPGLEGDDCMGILATMKGKDERIIVSIDKDMKTIPGLFYRNEDDGLVEISNDEADYWHLFQTLTGDSTDGYSGCPGIGPKKAEAILMGVAKPWGTGKEAWDAVVTAFVKAGLGEEEALVQARVARILRASDYNFKKKEPKLWNP